MKKKIDWRELLDWVRTIIEILLVVAAVAGTVWIFTHLGVANAETDVYPGEQKTETAYIVCMPDDHVNVRPTSGKRGTPLGWLDPGDAVELDGMARNGYWHCVNMSLEETEGWVYSGYIVYDQPVFVDCDAKIVSPGRLAARKYIGGRRTRWLKRGAKLHVYYMSEYWCVTNCGYVQSQYLELEEKEDDDEARG